LPSLLLRAAKDVTNRSHVTGFVSSTTMKNTRAAHAP
jgi:hypothetical protein